MYMYIYTMKPFKNMFNIYTEEERSVGVVCKNLHVGQPEVDINISLSDESDIIDFSVFC
jgi:hypothetical protein